MKAELHRRTLLGGVASLGVGLTRGAVAQSRYSGRQLVSQGAGGATQDAIQKAMFDRLDHELGCTSTQVPLLSAAAFARMRAEAAAPQIDMYLFSGGQEVTAAAEGLTADLGPLPNWDDIPANMKDPARQWAKFATIAEGILYRTDKIKVAPRSYKDFLNPEYDGHIAFPTIANGYGTDFLVMLARAFGGGEKAIEPGFTAMAKFAAHATIFKAAAEVPGLFAQSDIWIMPYDSTSAKRCKDAGLPVAFVSAEEGSPASFLTTCIARNSKNIDLAREAVNRFLGPDTQGAIAELLQWAPTNGKLKLPEALARQLPRPDQLVTLDMSTMTANRPAWTERWNKEIGHA
jgi:putative spermidine/putrescine transport system substrate-binding protein